jgi:hypothetical protein
MFVGSTGFVGRAAYRWAEGIGFEFLSEIVSSPGVTGDVAYRISGDGQIIIGSATADASGEIGFVSSIWGEVHGWRRTDQLLIDIGIDLSGWDEVVASDISDDGRLIVGIGRNPDGRFEAWLADLSNPTLLPGDYDSNHVVEQGDLDLVLLHWGAESTLFDPPEGWIRNPPSGIVDQAELDSVLLNWGNTQLQAAHSAAVPEPASVLLLLSSVATLHFFCKHRRKKSLS